MVSRIIHWMLPHNEMVEHHPIYHIEERSLRRRALSRLFQYTRYWWLSVVLTLIFLWLISVVNQSIQDMEDPNARLYGYYRVIETSGEFITWLLMPALATVVLLDFFATLASTSLINRDKVNGNWDLIRLTNLGEREIIITKHTLAQLRVWRLLTVISALRWSIVILFALQFCFLNDGYGTDLESFLRYNVAQQSQETTVYLIAIFIILYVFLAEPFWRVRTVTAIGLAASGRIHSTMFSILAGLGGVILMWISQAIMLAGVFFGIVKLIERLSNDYYFDPDQFTVALIFTLFVALVALLIRTHYGLLQRWSLKRTMRDAFREA